METKKNCENKILTYVIQDESKKVKVNFQNNNNQVDNYKDNNEEIYSRKFK